AAVARRSEPAAGHYYRGDPGRPVGALVGHAQHSVLMLLNKTPQIAGFADTVTTWQKQHGRHHLPWQDTRDPYRIWLSEIMLQQTQVATVIGYYQRFLSRFPDISSL